MTTYALSAREYLLRFEKLPPGASPGDLPVTALICAVLEVAEQQRAANLIAYERLHLGRPDSDNSRPVVSVPLSPWIEEIERLLNIAEVGDREQGAA